MTLFPHLIPFTVSHIKRLFKRETARNTTSDLLSWDWQVVAYFNVFVLKWLHFASFSTRGLKRWLSSALLLTDWSGTVSACCWVNTEMPSHFFIFCFWDATETLMCNFSLCCKCMSTARIIFPHQISESYSLFYCSQEIWWSCASFKYQLSLRYFS